MNFSLEKKTGKKFSSFLAQNPLKEAHNKNIEKRGSRAMK